MGVREWQGQRRRLGVRRLVAVTMAFSSVLAIGLPRPASAAPAPRLWTFAGALTVQSPDSVGSQLVAQRPTLCPAGKPIASSMTLTQALASARQTVIGLAGSSAVKAFDTSSTATSAVQSRAAAVGMFVDRKPVPSLLAMLRTHQLVPNDPTILSSISALLNILGHPKESLAVAKAADAMAAAPLSPMGISGQAILLNNEGEALLQLRRWADAERLLRQAVTLSPELSEAKVNLAVALLCQQKDEDAVKYYRLGRYRQHYDLVAQGTDPSAPSAPVISEVLDLSHGVSGTYPTFRIPA